MTDADIQELERKLWKTADDLRQGAGIKASQYAQPIFGLIFLRFADNKYRKIEAEIVAEYNKRKGTLRECTLKEIAIKKCGFYLPDCARYDYIHGHLIVTIEDTGNGIESSSLPHIFERFASKTKNGTGLGLPICKELTEQMGGSFEINSELGRGTTVWISIPCQVLNIERKDRL